MGVGTVLHILGTSRHKKECQAALRPFLNILEWFQDLETWEIDLFREQKRIKDAARQAAIKDNPSHLAPADGYIIALLNLNIIREEGEHLAIFPTVQIIINNKNRLPEIPD